MEKIETFDGEIWEGKKLSHQRELPKNTRLHKYIYDDKFNCYGIYIKYAKRGNKIFLIKSI